MEYLSRAKVLQLIKQAVIFAPLDMGASRANSFAIINGLNDFNNDNLGYKAEDILNNDVWTRQAATLNQIDIQYPVVCPIIYGGTRMTEIPTPEKVTTIDDLRILVADRYQNNKEDSASSEGRSVSQIMDDTEAMLNKIMDFLINVKAYKVEYTLGHYIDDYFNTDFLDWCLSNNKIVGYSEPTNSHYFNTVYKKFLNLNLNQRFERLEYPTSKDMIVGTYLNIKSLSFYCGDGEFDFFIEGESFDKTKDIYFGN